ncbi:UDP-glucose 4-epimerase GalE [Marinicauda salina]|uniref:UDP-glucose 4-epimerase n=1 Tax=Marinicauda salina TaxID=2135793 RepID=A0A2U2BXD9_9PROT|nr:UDP-glucose 4-epimerase GalE [Marinicauda salina]PWE18681.1 UDP-glucose 4-epimerase GalE [Marinicauda salina]
MAETILVAGGAGYIGSHACKALHAAGYRPVVYDDLSSGHEHAVRWGPLVRGDIRDVAALDAAFAEHRPAAVMHFAASIEVGEGEREPLKYWDNNVAGSASLLAAMGRAGCESIVFSSTCAVYGEPEALPISEAEPLKPASVYGRTKRAVEQMLADAARAHSLRYAALRYFNAAGASPDGEIGEEHDPETHLIPNALKAAAGLGEAMRLFGEDYDTPDGTCVRDYIHVADLADAHVAALKRLIGGTPEIVCNLGTGAGFSVREILNAVERATGRPVPHEINPRRPGDVARLYADVGRARDLLDFRPARSTPETIIADAWAFHAPRWGVEKADG